MEAYRIMEKNVGETPLEAVERLRMSEQKFSNTKMTYAGRLDPMASGALLVLIGDECKLQEKYHALDKQYTFQVLLGVGSDTGDVLGILTQKSAPEIGKADLRRRLHTLTGNIHLPYPHFSSKTVYGKPLHTWAIEGRLDEIKIPTKESTVYTLTCTAIETLSAHEVYAYATKKIETIPPVTDPRKALGNDFRRSDVRQSWKAFLETPLQERYQILTIDCIASSGTYMRTLANEIAKLYDTIGLAYSIHRNTIGYYQPLFLSYGFWKKKF